MKKKETNKTNLIKFLIILIMFLIVIIPFISAPDSTPPKEGIIVELNDGNVDLSGTSGKLTITGEEGIDTLELASGIIPNIKSGDIVVKEGNPVSGKLFFSDDSSFDLDNQHITVQKDGYIEFKDGKIIVSKDTAVEVDDTKIKAMIDETEIKMEKNLVEVNGIVSVDYELSPAKIILSGKNSILELQTEEKEKFEFKNLDDKELIVNIGSFHKSEDCIEKNCISYQDMGIGISGEEWDKLKIDGNALITKYYNEERVYQIKFEDGKARLRRDSLSNLENIDFDKNTIINYDNGNIKFRIDKSRESSKRVRIQTVDKSNIEIGDLTISEYLQEKIKELKKLVSSWLQEEQENIEQQESPIEGEQGQYYEYFPETTKDIIKRSEETIIKKGNKEYTTILELAEKYATNDKEVVLFLALWNKESNLNPYVINEGGYIGLGQLKAQAFEDVIDWYPELFPGYAPYKNNYNYLMNCMLRKSTLNWVVMFE